MKTKSCSKCNITKPIEDFQRRSDFKQYYTSWCKNCLSEYKKTWYINNKARINKKHKLWLVKHLNYIIQYYQKNKDRIKKQHAQWLRNNYEKRKIQRRLWRINNRDKEQLLDKKYRDKYKLSKNIKTLIGLSLKGNKNNRPWEKLVSYSLKELKIHLEKLFKKGMSWANYGKWHIDHIIPISLWQFDNSEDREFKQCWALANLQPLWAIENFKKGNRI